MIRILLAILFTAISAQSVQVNTKVFELERDFETRLTSQLKEILGDRKFALNVKIDSTAPVDPIQKIGEVIDLGYMQVPAIVNPAPKSESSLNFNSVKVSVQVQNPVDSELKRRVEKFISTQLQEYKPKIVVGGFDVVPTEIKKAPEPETKDKAPEERLPTWLWLALAGIASFIFVSLSGISRFSKAFQQGSLNIASSLQTLRNLRIDNSGDPQGTGAADSSLFPDGAEDMNLEIGHFRIEDRERNLEILTSTLEQKPFKISKITRSSSEDAYGLRWLFTKLKPQQLELLERIYDKKFLSHLGSESSKVGPGFNPEQWFQHFIERLQIEVIKGDDILELAFSSDDMTWLLKQPRSQLIKNLISSEEAASYRIITELLTPEEINGIFSELKPQQKDLLLRQALISTDELQAFLPTLKEKMKMSQSDSSQDLEDQGLGKIFDATLKSLDGMLINEEAEFVKKLQSINRPLHEKIKLVRWTVPDIFFLSDATLTSLLAEMNADLIFSVLVSSPQDFSKRLVQLMPDTSKKEIVLDLVSRATWKSSKSDLLAASQMTRQWVLQIKTRFDRGDFESVEVRAAA